MSPFICFFHVLRVSRLFVSANGSTSMYHSFSLCVCISFLCVCVCVYVYIYIYTVFYSFSQCFIRCLLPIRLPLCKERKRIFLFYLFSLFRKGYEFIFNDVSLLNWRVSCAAGYTRVQDNLCVTLLLMSWNVFVSDVRETN